MFGENVTRELAALAELGFDGAAYKARYEDLAAACPDGGEALHFVTYGLREGRIAPLNRSLKSALEMLPRLWPDPLQRLGLTLSLLAARSAELRRPEHILESLRELSSVIDAFDTVAVIGDSHSWMFGGTGLNGHVLVLHQLCSGASARGLANPKSRSRQDDVIKQFLGRLESSTRRPVPAIFQFGQVDIEFVYNFSRITSGLNRFDHEHYLHFASDSAQRYVEALTSWSGAIWPRSAMCILGVGPPSIIDQHTPEGYINGHITQLHAEDEVERVSAGVRRLEFPDLKTRTNLHREFNQLLSSACRAADLTFIDPFDRFTGSDGLVAEPFIRAHGGSDHHIDPHAPETRAVTLKLLEAALFQCSPAR